MIFDIIKHAKQLIYDNSKSALKSNNVQGAIDEVKESVDTLNESLENLDGTICYGDRLISDLDDFRGTGIVVDQVSNTAKNSPFNTYGVAFYIGMSSYGVQFAIGHFDQNLYFRHLYAGSGNTPTWSTWQKITKS